MKKEILAISIVLLMLCGCKKNVGDTMDNNEITEIVNMMNNYETSIKNYDFEVSDYYWINPEDNMYVSVINFTDDSIELEVCKEIYVEKLDFQISDIKVDGNTATANCDVQICVIGEFITKIPELYDHDELMKKDKEELKKEFQKQLEEYTEIWENGTVYFEKIGENWKIKSIE